MRYFDFFLQMLVAALVWATTTNFLLASEPTTSEAVFYIFAYSGVIAMVFIAIKILLIKEE